LRLVGASKLTEPFSSMKVDIRPLEAYFKIELNGSVIFLDSPRRSGRRADRAGLWRQNR